MDKELSQAERLTLLRHYLTSIRVTNSADYTIWERMCHLGIPPHDPFGDVWPLASPPYSLRDFERLVLTARSIGETP